MEKFLANLPEQMAKPLHILPPWIMLLIWLVLGALVLIAIIWLLVWLLSRLSKKTKNKKPDRVGPDGITRTLGKIKDQYMASRNYREGCHALSAVLKAHIENQTGLNVEEMTVREIALRFPEQTGEFFRDLSRLQFGREEPEEVDFNRICDRSRKIAKVRHRAGAA